MDTLRKPITVLQTRDVTQYAPPQVIVARTSQFWRSWQYINDRRCAFAFPYNDQFEWKRGGTHKFKSYECPTTVVSNGFVKSQLI